MAESAALIDQAPDLAAIRAARERIRAYVRRDPHVRRADRREIGELDFHAFRSVAHQLPAAP